MTALMRKLLGLSPREQRRVLPLALAYFLVMASIYLLKPARNALFLDRAGVGQLPYVMVLVAVAGAVAASVFARASKGIQIRRTISATFGVLMAMLVLFRLLLPSGTTPLFYLFYVWVSIYGLMATSLIWLFANSVLDAREARRLFSFIGTGGILGAIVGGLVTGWAAARVGTENLLLGCVGLLAVCLFVLLRFTRPRRGTEGEAESAKPDRGQQERAEAAEAASHQLLRPLAMVVALTAVVAVIVDVQFNEIVDRVFSDKDEKTAFFGNFFAALSAFAFVFQLFVTPRILRAAGVGAALLFLPLGMGLGSASVIFVTGLSAAILVKVGDGGFRHSIQKAATEILFVPIPEAVKERTKVFFDVTVDTVSTGVGAIIVLLLTGPLAMSYPQLGWVSMGLVVVWVLLIQRVRRGYVGAFRKALERQAIDPSQLRTRIRDSASIEALEGALGGNERQMSYGLDLLASAEAPHLIERVGGLLEHDSAEVRARALRFLQQQRGSDGWTEQAQALIVDPDAAVGAEAVAFCLNRSDRPAAERLAWLRALLRAEETDGLTDQAREPLTRERGQAAALGFVARYGTDEEVGLIDEALISHLIGDGAGDPASLVSLAETLGRIGGAESAAHLGRLAEDPRTEVGVAAIRAFGALGEVSRIGWLIEQLPNADYRAAAREALAQIGDAALPALDAALSDRALPYNLRFRIPRVMSACGTAEAQKRLLGQLERRSAGLRVPVLDALLRIRGASGPPLGDPRQLAPIFEREVDRYLAIERQLELQPGETRKEQLLRRALAERRRESLGVLFDILALRYDPGDMRIALQGLTDGDPGTLANAMEFLENLLDRDLKRRLLPAFERRPPHAAIAAPVPAVLEAEGYEGARNKGLEGLVGGADRWLRACAIFCVIEAPPASLKPLLEARMADPGQAPVLSILEKVIALQSVDVFAEVTTEQLSYLAAIAEEVDFDADQSVYQEQDPSDAMYLVLDGNVRLHRGETEVTRAGASDVFGTWALFDDVPRLMSATAATPSRALRIRTADFIDLLADNVAVTQGILKTMVRRLQGLAGRVRRTSVPNMPARP